MLRDTHDRVYEYMRCMMSDLPTSMRVNITSDGSIGCFTSADHERVASGVRGDCLERNHVRQASAQVRTLTKRRYSRWRSEDVCQSPRYFIEADGWYSRSLNAIARES